MIGIRTLARHGLQHYDSPILENDNAILENDKSIWENHNW